MAQVANRLGRQVPIAVNGVPYQPYRGAYAPLQPGPRFTPPTHTAQRRGAAKLVPNLDEIVAEAVPDDGWVAIPHYYRNDPTGLRLVIEALRRTGKRGVNLMTAAFFPAHAPVLLPAIRDGVIGGFEANAYGAVAAAVGGGQLGDRVVVGRSHGGRARAMQQGERRVDLAIGWVPIADRWGNANGVMGRPGEQCGSIGLFEPDVRWSRRAALLTSTVHPGLLAQHPLDMRLIDHVVQVDSVGDNRGIGTGTTDLRRVRGDPIRERIAANVLAVLAAARVVRPGFNFQVGSGAGLLVLAQMLDDMRARGVCGGFTVGGSMEHHVDMLQEGLIEVFLDGQCFQPSARLFRSLREDPRHVDVSTSLFYSPAAKQEGAALLDVVVLGASEVDREFNLNTVTGYDGVLRSGIGGGQDAAAGAKLTVVALPLARVNRSGRSAPCVRDRVTTVVTPGEVVDAVITEEAVALDTASDSPYLDELRAGVAREGVRLVDIDELVAASSRKARELGRLMDEPRFTDRIVYAIEWRDGRLIDVVRQLDTS